MDGVVAGALLSKAEVLVEGTGRGVTRLGAAGGGNLALLPPMSSAA